MVDAKKRLAALDALTGTPCPQCDDTGFIFWIKDDNVPDGVVYHYEYGQVNFDAVAGDRITAYHCPRCNQGDDENA